MLIGDFQFIRHVFMHELQSYDEVLNNSIEIQIEGEPDTLVARDKHIVYHNPSSVLKFLFILTHRLISDLGLSPSQIDASSVVLLQMIKNYVYSDFDTAEKIRHPVIIDMCKNHTIHTILSDIVEPLVGNIPRSNLFYTPCEFTNAARCVENLTELRQHYNIRSASISSRDFPLIVVNTKIHNNAAVTAHILVLTLSLAVGETSSARIIKNILLNNEELLNNLVLVLKTLNGDPLFVMDFIKYLQCHADFSKEDYAQSAEIFYNTAMVDPYLQKHIKLAAEKYTPSVWNQWSQWSMMMGLIEKQLGSMRGSMWPTTEKMMPHDTKFKKMMAEKIKRKKSHLNFEEMLETIRDVYDHNAIEPGKLTEVMLKDNRVWK